MKKTIVRIERMFKLCLSTSETKYILYLGPRMGNGHTSGRWSGHHSQNTGKVNKTQYQRLLVPLVGFSLSSFHLTTGSWNQVLPRHGLVNLLIMPSPVVLMYGPTWSVGTPFPPPKLVTEVFDTKDLPVGLVEALTVRFGVPSKMKAL